eukprot:CAMPEP_0170554738 /NCGR_PEP_ID=MMETSP0211-20121228/12614_1 /TAXON_ID=311385 /ORGANISM="Pseudokeronopsis sp., Strain OXSARD2" /LENGTH=109 /DNA_ID=CAMNT_0010864045 /DNA_START=63 /DNA_END=392 /DNA_ORIENTATION=-
MADPEEDLVDRDRVEGDDCFLLAPTAIIRPEESFYDKESKVEGDEDQDWEFFGNEDVEKAKSEEEGLPDEEEEPEDQAELHSHLQPNGEVAYVGVGGHAGSIQAAILQK